MNQLYERRIAARKCIYCKNGAIPDRTWCEACRVRRSSKEYKEHRRNWRLRGGKERRDVETERHRKYVAANRQKVAEYRKNRHYAERYGMTIADVDSLAEWQDYLCAICMCDISVILAKHVHVDHNHSMANVDESVRALLCGPCNKMIGHAKENPAILRQAAEYLSA